MTLYTAANSHLTLDFDDSPEALWEEAIMYLLAEGFVREGTEVLGPDQSLYPHFVRGSLTLAAGWDIWSGKYLLALSDDGDDFLRELIAIPYFHLRETI